MPWQSSSWCLPRILLLFRLETLVCSPFFYFLYWSLCCSYSVLASMYILCGDGEGRKLVYYLVGHQNMRWLWLQWSQLYVMQRSCHKGVALCVVSFGAQGGRSVRTCGRKDGTDVCWAKGHTVAETTSCSPEATLFYFHIISWMPGWLSKFFFLGLPLVECDYVTKFSITEY